MTTVNSIMIADSYGGKVKLWNVMYADGGNCFITQVAQEALLNTVPSKNDSRNTKNKPCDFRCLAICISYLWYPCNGYKSISPFEDVKQLGCQSWFKPSFMHIAITKKYNVNLFSNNIEIKHNVLKGIVKCKVIV